MMHKLTEGYHPAYMQGWNECVDELATENGVLRDILRRLMSEFDEPDEYMTVFQEAKALLEQGD